MQQIVSIGLIIIVLGVLVVLAGMFFPFFFGQEKTGNQLRGGAVLFIGPIPIILGTDKSSAAAVAIIAVVLMVLAYLLFNR